MCALLVAVETLQQTAGYENYDKFYEGLGMITGIIRMQENMYRQELNSLLKHTRTIPLFIRWEAEPAMGLHIWKVFAFSWKCSGLIPAVFIQENICHRLKSQMQTVRL